ncbi:MAG: hypothetical protein H7336_05505 [Bacteriovorax sp.]|nr:hypothetical protein [Bacteriovorax sp.]
MKYKTFKLDCTIEERAKNQDMTVNEYIYHLIRLNEEYKSEREEEIINKVELIQNHLNGFEKALIYIDGKITKITEKLDDRN